MGRLRRESRLGRDEDEDERWPSEDLLPLPLPLPPPPPPPPPLPSSFLLLLLPLLRGEGDEAGGVASGLLVDGGAAGAAGAAAIEDLGVVDEALGREGDDKEWRLCIPDCEAGGIGTAAMRTRCRRRALLGEDEDDDEAEEAAAEEEEEVEELVGVGVAGEAGAEADAEAGDDGERRGGEQPGDGGVGCCNNAGGPRRWRCLG